MLSWEEMVTVRAHWSRALQFRSRLAAPGDRILIWLTFERAPTAAASAGRDALAALSGSESPTVPVESLAVDPHLTIDILRFYLANPEVRGELASDDALARIDTLAADRSS